MARPLGPIAQAALKALQDGPLDARELCLHLQVPDQRMLETCCRLLKRGQIQIVDRKRRRGSRRPLFLYALPTTYAPVNHLWAFPR